MAQTTFFFCGPVLSSKKDAINAKLAPKFIGPLVVKKIISPVIVDLHSPQGKWYRHVHIQDLNRHQKVVMTTNNRT